MVHPSAPRQSLLGNVALALGVTLFFLAGLEGALRLLERQRPKPPVEDYIWDWQDKWKGDFYTIRSEVNGWPPWQEINGDGLRDRSHPLSKPAGTTRLVFLGDSVTLGDQIEAKDAIPQVLQQRFDAEGRPIEVFNVALWGWSTRQERRAYQDIARKYRPDQVILGVCLNDIPELQNNLTQPPRWLARLHRRSAVVRKVVNASGREIQSVEQLFQEPPPPRVREAMARFLAEVRALRAEVEKDGARFAMVVFPFRFQVTRGAPSPVVQQRIAEFCRAETLPCLDLLPAVQAVGESAFVDYDHFSAAGASLVAHTLVESGLLKGEPSAGELLGPDASPHGARQRLREDRFQMRAAAAFWLGTERKAGARSEGPTDSEALLRAALSDAHEAVRLAAARALDGSPPLTKETRVTLFAALDDAAEAVRWSAARALSASGITPADIGDLTAALRHPDPYVKGFGAFALGELGPAAAPAVPDLIAALKAEDGYDRGGAAAALGRIGPAAGAAVPVLLEALRGADGDRRFKAARILGRIGPAAAAAGPALVQALGDPNEYVRTHAARALGRIQPPGDDLVPALRKATRDADPAVRREAETALRALDGR